MADLNAAQSPGWLRIAALLGLLWNLFGVYAYLQTVGVLAGADPNMTRVMPAWVTGAFAIAVFGGALGSLGLALLKSWATWLLYLSLVCVLAMDVWTFVLSGNGAAMANGEKGLTAAVTLIAILLAWLARHADSRRWLS